MSGRVGSITTDIVSDGLVFNMDAANRACYPRTGTTATDTVNNIAGTLNGTSGDNNTPQWEDINSGVFDFDGTDDVIIGDLPDNFIRTQPTSGRPHVSISFWMKPTGTSNCQVLGFSDQNNGSYIGVRYLASGGSLRIGCRGASAFGVGFSGITSGEWNHIVAIKERATYSGGSYQPYDQIKSIYLNGLLISAGNSTVNAVTPSKMIIGRIAETGLGYYGENFEGSIGPISLYHKELSASEVLHNYNALRGRFGV